MFHFAFLLSDLDNGYAGWCTDVCCNQKTEETCYDYDGGTSNYCALIADGGCPCPKGTEKCGQGKILQVTVLQRKLNFISLILMFHFAYLLSDLDNNLAGWCTDICCDDETKETCYDYRSDTVTCALIADGGCSCPKGTVRCGLGKMLLFLVLESYELHFTYI